MAPVADRDVVVGELDELWRRRARERGELDARWWYRRQVVGFTLRAWATRRVARRNDRAPHDDREGGMGRIEELIGDVRWAFRSLRKRPTFALVAVTTLALGIGANSAVFTLANAHFLTPLPYDRPDELVLIWETVRNSPEVTTVSPGNYFTWRERARSFSGIAAFNVDGATLSGDEAAEQVPAAVVSPDFFGVLGVTPELGTLFDAQSAREADGRLVVLGHALWVRRYGADPDVIGRSIRVDGRPHTVVGVLPATYRQPEKSLGWQVVELWRPLLLDTQHEDFDSRFLRTVARLAPGVPLERAREEMSTMAVVMAEAHPEQNAGRAIQLWTLDDYLMAESRPVLLLLLMAGAAVLLIVCSNLANLTMARGQDRRREFAVRAALGSGAYRLVRQVLVESVLLAVVGAAVAATALYMGADLLQMVQERFFTSLVAADVDLRVLVGTTVVALLAGTLFGLPLAVSASATDLRGALVEGGERGGRGPGTTQDLLIVGQVALATTLVVVAVLLARSFTEIVGVPPGFEPAGLVTFEVSAPSATYEDRDDVEAYLRDVWRQMEGVPGVRRVAMVSDLPFTTENRWTPLEVEGVPYDRENPPRSELKTVVPEYFDVMGIPVNAGSLPEDAWSPIDGEIPVAVNQRLAELFWPGEDPLGKTFANTTFEPVRRYRVGAVVGNVLDDGFQGSPEPLFYVPWGAQPIRRMAFILQAEGGRAGGDGGALDLSTVRTALARVDPDIPAADLRALDDLMGDTVARPRAASLISGVFAFIALMVAAAGIYGVLSYMVQTRTREIGIRAALGASSQRILRIVMSHSTRLLIAGLGLGVAGAIVAARALATVLFGVRPWDPLSLAVAVVLLGSVGSLAAWLPARRAIRVDPIKALRSD